MPPDRLQSLFGLIGATSYIMEERDGVARECALLKVD